MYHLISGLLHANFQIGVSCLECSNILCFYKVELEVTRRCESAGSQKEEPRVGLDEGKHFEDGDEQRANNFNCKALVIRLWLCEASNSLSVAVEWK
jgi:hypothetical protein